MKDIIDSLLGPPKPPEVQRRLNQACDAFEAAWQAGSRPAIEPFLADVPEPERAELLAELVLLEVHYRRHAGEKPDVNDYRGRFPALDGARLSRALERGAPPAVTLPTIP